MALKEDTGMMETTFIIDKLAGRQDHLHESPPAR